MPFRARYEGRIVVPAMVPEGESVECLDCGASLSQRGGPERAQHFYHPPNTTSNSCLAQDGVLGESETHARCVALAVEALAEAFDGQYTRCQPEVSLQVGRTPTPPERRRADAFLEFSDENPVFGQGIILEVQHKHHTKDVEGTTYDYLSKGYSVAWLDADEFNQDVLDYRVVDEKFRDENAAGYTVRDYDAREFNPSGRSTFDWEQASRGCWYYRDYDTHAWFRVSSYVHQQGREYEACRYCDARRQYDDELTWYVYDYDGVLAPEFNIADLRDAYIETPADGYSFEEWVAGEGRYSDLTLFEDALTHGSVAACRGETNLHVWRYPQAIDGGDGMLWGCKNCPTRLLAKRRGKRFILFGDWPNPSWPLMELEANPWRCGHRCHTEYGRYDRNGCPDCHAPLPVDED